MKVKNFLLAGLTAILLGCQSTPKLSLGNRYLQSSLISPVSLHYRSVQEFPDSIPGAKEVRKYDIKDSKHCLVHILQMHLLSFDSKYPFNYEVVYGDMYKTEQTQKDIYSILSYLREGGMKNVYYEGLYPEIWPDKGDGFLADYSLNKHKISIIIELSKREQITKNLELLAFHKQLISDASEYKFAGGAGFLLFKEGKVNLFSAESESAYKNSDSSSKKIKDIENTFDAREDVLLDIISKQNEFFAVTTYGGSHAWGGVETCGDNYPMYMRTSLRDNIAVFNIKNPNNKFSLIEIEPVSYRELYLDGKGDFIPVSVSFDDD